MKSRKREDELKATLETKTRELENQSATATAGLEKARSELAGLEAPEGQGQGREDRVVGLYGTIRLAIRDRRYEDASNGANALASFLRTRISFPTRHCRIGVTRPFRGRDSRYLCSIRARARFHRRRQAARPGRSPGVGTRMRPRRPRRALKTGNTELASAKYGEALSKVPEILAAHEFFLDQLKASETARRSRLDEALSSADRASGRMTKPHTPHAIPRPSRTCR